MKAFIFSTLHWTSCAAIPASMSAPDDPQQYAHADHPSDGNEQWPSLNEYTMAHSASCNDCDWLHEFVSSDAISTGKISPRYLVRVYCNETEAVSTTTTKDFRTGSSALQKLRRTLASKNIRAVILCHRDSSQVDPDVLELLWTKFKLEPSFMRHHFDYKDFKSEPGCSGVIRDYLHREDSLNEDYWTFGGRWNPIRLPSETRASLLRLSVDSECLSVCSRDGVVIALIRSKALYQQPLSRWDRHTGREILLRSCAVDLFAATTDMSSLDHAFPSDPSEVPYSIVHFYARLLVLRCYEDYSLRHDTQPIDMDESDRLTIKGHPYIRAMHHRRLELVKLKQDLFAYLGPLAPAQVFVTVRKDSDSADGPYRRKLRSLLTDIEMLLSLYDNIIGIYESHNHQTAEWYKADLASEQLEEAKESKATAISLSKLSNLAFLYLPINFVCAMLGMNLSIFGQGQVPLWVFFTLVVFFGLLTYLPIYLLPIDDRRIQLNRLAYHLAGRSFSAGFWFFAFSLTHDHGQNFEIMNSGLAQVFLGYTGSGTKGWTDGRQDRFFEKATWGSEAFWKERVKKIFNAVEELKSSNEPTALTV